MSISKHVLRRLRRWSTYHQDTTIFEAHAYLMRAPMSTKERETVRDLASSTVEIRDFLQKVCGFQATRGTRVFEGRPYTILQNTSASVGSRQAYDRYIDFLTS